MPDTLTFAIDPGTIDSGIAVARNGELIETDTIHVSKSLPALQRTLDMMDKIENYIIPAWEAQYKKLQVHIPYESPVTFHGENGTGRPIASLLNLVVLLEYWARNSGFQTFAYPVNDIKEGIAGRRSAPKTEVELIMRHEYNLHEMKKTNHEWDAISIFTYHLRQLAVGAAIMQETSGGKS